MNIIPSVGYSPYAVTSNHQNTAPLKVEGDYCGHYKKNLPHGHGVFAAKKGLGSDTLHVDGSWKNGKLHGNAHVIRILNGIPFHRISGNWEGHYLDGVGEYEYNNHHNFHETYSGDWKQGLKDGDGQYIFTVNLASKPHRFAFSVNYKQGELCNIYNIHGPFNILPPGNYGNTNNGFGFIIDKDRNLQCGTFKDTLPEYNHVIPISPPLAEKGRNLFCKNYEHPLP